jgi:hypothetical protein
MTTKIEPTEWLYRPLLRPSSFCTLPEGLSWNYVEIPSVPPTGPTFRSLGIALGSSQRHAN